MSEELPTMAPGQPLQRRTRILHSATFNVNLKNARDLGKVLQQIRIAAGKIRVMGGAVEVNLRVNGMPVANITPDLAPEVLPLDGETASPPAAPEGDETPGDGEQDGKDAPDSDKEPETEPEPDQARAEANASKPPRRTVKPKAKAKAKPKAKGKATPPWEATPPTED